MNSEQQKIKSLLTKLVDGQDYDIKPAAKEQIEIFIQRAVDNGVDSKIIKQLVDLYEVADFFHYEIIIGFHRCDDLTIFELWDDKELWLGLRDFYIIRWTKSKFCLGDASTISFSADYEFDTLIELIEGCIKEINEADYFDKNNTNNNQ